MRLAEGIVIDKEKTFGLLKFSALRREVFLQNEDGTVSTEVKERTYDLKSREQGQMIQVSIPASVPLKEFDYNAEVEIINPVADTVANAKIGRESTRLNSSHVAISYAVFCLKKKKKKKHVKITYKDAHTKL